MLRRDGVEDEISVDEMCAAFKKNEDGKKLGTMAVYPHNICLFILIVNKKIQPSSQSMTQFPHLFPSTNSALYDPDYLLEETALVTASNA